MVTESITFSLFLFQRRKSYRFGTGRGIFGLSPHFCKFRVHFGVNCSFNWLVWQGCKSYELNLLLFCKQSLKCCTYLFTFFIIIIKYIYSNEWFNVCFWELNDTEHPDCISRNTIKTRIWLVKGRGLLSSRTFIGRIFCLSNAPRDFIKFRPQWGATAAEWSSADQRNFTARRIHIKHFPRFGYTWSRCQATG